MGLLNFVPTKYMLSVHENSRLGDSSVKIYIPPTSGEQKVGKLRQLSWQGEESTGKVQ